MPSVTTPAGGRAAQPIVQPILQPIVTNVLRRMEAPPIELVERLPVPELPARPGREVAIGDRGDLFVSPTGHLVPKPGVEQTASILELGDTLFRASQLAERGQNIFALPAITIEQKTTLLTELIGAFNRGLAQIPNNGFENREQALQIRSCAAPLILDLARSLEPGVPAQAELRSSAISQYFKLLEAETHGLNRNFMVYDLDRSKADLPEDVRPVVDALMDAVGQVAPPYEEWFANGNDTLRADYHIGAGFWEEEVRWFEDQGFSKEDNGNGTFTMKKTFEHQGVRTNVELLMHDGKHEIFKRMSDPRVHVVAYSGHASYGRNVTGALAGGSAQAGAKAFFGLHCGGGKGVHNAILDRYPDLHVVQSRNSSYGPQDRRTFLNALEGFARRDDWRAISERNRRTNSSNYYYPTDTLYRKSAEDRDDDGKIDAWDRVVNYNSFRPQAEVRDQLTPKDPGVPANRLDGSNFNGAVQRFTRLAGYNEWAEELQNQGLISRGYYEGAAADPMFQWNPHDGDRFEIRLNKHYAHASEEALGAVLHYRLGRHCAQNKGLEARDATLVGLLMAAKCLNVDDSNLDHEIWKKLLEIEQLPPAIRLNDVYASVKEDEHRTAGSTRSLRSLSEKLARQGIPV